MSTRGAQVALSQQHISRRLREEGPGHHRWASTGWMDLDHRILLLHSRSNMEQVRESSDAVVGFPALSVWGLAALTLTFSRVFSGT